LIFVASSIKYCKIKSLFFKRSHGNGVAILKTWNPGGFEGTQKQQWRIRIGQYNQVSKNKIYGCKTVS